MARKIRKTELRTRMLNGLEGMALVLTARAQRLAAQHVDTTATYRSIGHKRRQNDVLWGSTGKSALPYLEFGFRPHWVPGRYIAGWMSRKNVGVQRRVISRGKNKGKLGKITTMALGVYVGGPGSTLQSGPGGAKGRLGWKRQERTWNTKGGTSPYLPAGKVGFPILRPAVASLPKAYLIRAFIQGYRRSVGGNS